MASITSGLLGQATIIVTGIIAARVLGVEDRGHLALLVILAAGICQLGALGVPLAVTYEIASDQASASAVGNAVIRLGRRQSIVVLLVHAALVCTLVWQGNNDLKIAGAISVVNSPAMLAQQYALAVLQGLSRFRAFNLLRLLPSVGYALLAAMAWAAGLTSLVDLTLAWTAASVLAILITGVVAYRTIAQLGSTGRSPTGNDPTALQRRMRVFGRKSVLASASPVDTLRLDQAAVGLFLTPAALGLYVTAVAFTNLPRFVAQSIGIVAFPHVAATSSVNAARRILWRFALLTGVLCAVLVVALQLCVAWLLPLLFGPAFTDAVPVARILLVGAWFISLRRVLTDAVRGIGRPGAGTIAECVSWLSIVAMLPIVIPHGVNAVAWAMTAGAVLSCATLVWLVMRRSAARGLKRSADPPTVESPTGSAGRIE